MSGNYHLKRFVVFGETFYPHEGYYSFGASSYLKDFDHKESAVGYAAAWVDYPVDKREAHVWDTKEMWIIYYV